VCVLLVLNMQLNILWYTIFMKLQKVMPSKKFLKFFGGILGLILVIVLIGAVANKKAIYKQNANSKGQVLVVGDTVEKDADQDGLKDWEELLWGTDPYNPDTDGNGIQDGAQIRKIQGEIGGFNLGEGSLATDTTKTGALTRDILTIAKAVNQSGPLTPESQEAITDEIAKYLEKRQQTVYGISDITITEKPTANQARAYATLIKNSVEGTPLSATDIQLIAGYEENMDSGNMAPYIQTAEKFREERDFIKKTAVPEQYITIHLNYLNSLEGLRSLYADIAVQEEDPAKALAAFLSAQAILDQYGRTLELMRE
jgi:hypothetical protein